MNTNTNPQWQRQKCNSTDDVLETKGNISPCANHHHGMEQWERAEPSSTSIPPPHKHAAVYEERAKSPVAARGHREDGGLIPGCV